MIPADLQRLLMAAADMMFQFVRGSFAQELWAGVEERGREREQAGCPVLISGLPKQGGWAGATKKRGRGKREGEEELEGVCVPG